MKPRTELNTSFLFHARQLQRSHGLCSKSVDASRDGSRTNLRHKIRPVKHDHKAQRRAHIPPRNSTELASGIKWLCLFYLSFRLVRTAGFKLHTYKSVDFTLDGLLNVWKQYLYVGF